jgi:hypothetical protein
MLSVIEFKSTEVTDDLQEKKKKVFSVWSDTSDDQTSIHILVTDTQYVWECKEDLSIKHKPSVINEGWEKYSAKLLNIFQFNPSNASYEFKSCQSIENGDKNDICITIKEEISIAGSKKTLLKDFILLKRNDASLQSFHEAISKKLKIQNEKNNKYLQEKLNQAKEIDRLRGDLQIATVAKEEYISKAVAKMILILNSKKRHLANNDINLDESDHGSVRDSHSDDDKKEVRKKVEVPKKKSQSEPPNENDMKRTSTKSSTALAYTIKGKTIVDEKGLATILAQSQDNTIPSQSQSQSTSQKSARSAFQRMKEADDDDDDLFKF